MFYLYKPHSKELRNSVHRNGQQVDWPGKAQTQRAEGVSSCVWGLALAGQHNDIVQSCLILCFCKVDVSNML